MTFNIKNLFILSFIFFGFHIFIKEYNNLNNNINSFKIQNYKSVVNKSSENIEQINNSSDNTKFDKIKLDNNQKKTSNFIIKEIVVAKGDNFSNILKKFSFSEKIILEVIEKIEVYYDLKKLKVNQVIRFYLNNENKLEKIELNDSVESILIIKFGDKISIERKILEKEFFQASKEFVISESLYSDGTKNEIPQKILIDLIRLFSFDLDFQRDIRINTVVSLSYEYFVYKKNNQTQYKDINYALISIEGKDLEYFKFLTDDGYIDYFSREGKNVKKSLLKTPLDGARLSSNFGMRKHPISGYNKMHKGVDFAAPTGTPIYAGGNGVVEYVGNNGGYGKYIRIKHNNDYKTAYAHLSKYQKGISKGVRVNQGEVIGYVGNTGNSTGPHLHYEIIYQNKHINPLKMKLPSGKVLKGEEFQRFEKELKLIYANHLNLLYE